MVRPDDLVADGAGENAFDIAVDAVEFHGRSFVVEGVTASGQRLRGTADRERRDRRARHVARACRQAAAVRGARLSMRRRLAAHEIDRTLLLLLPAVVFLAVVFMYPFGYGLVLSFQPERYVGALGNYQQFFADPFLRDTITITLGLAVPAALFNVVASVPIAYRLRGAFRGKRLLTAMLVMPVTLGTVLIAKGLLTLLGARGWVNRALVKAASSTSRCGSSTTTGASC